MFKAKITAFLAIIAIISALFASCTIRKIDKDEEHSDKMTTKDIDAKDFNKIQVAGSADVEFTQDSTYRVSLDGDEETLSKVEVTVSNGTLVIKNKTKKVGINNNRDYKVYVSAPELIGIDINGAGKFEADSIATKSFDAEINGAGKVKIEHLTCENCSSVVNGEITGAGQIELEDVTANAVNIKVTGAGQIDIEENNVEKSVFSVSGAGQIEGEFNDCGSLEGNVAGVCNRKLKGNVKFFKSSSTGVGNFNTSKLKVGE